MSQPTKGQIDFAEVGSLAEQADVRALVTNELFIKHAENIRDALGNQPLRKLPQTPGRNLVFQSADGKVTLGLKDLDGDGKFDYVNAVLPAEGGLTVYQNFTSLRALQEILPTKGIPSRY